MIKNTRVKVQLKKKSRKGNARPYGVVILTFDRRASMSDTASYILALEKTFNDASNGIETKALVLNGDCKIQYIALK